MQKPIISIIVSIAKNRAIGKDNQLLWQIPEDLKHFKKITSGHVVLMGQKTYESIGKPLPNRTNVVISDDYSFNPRGVVVTRSFEEGLNKAREIEKEEIFIIGGGSIYRQFLPMTDKLYLTVVEGDYDADTFFPDYSEFKNIVSEEKSSNGKYEFTYLELTR
ncbi:MAG: dihydrofolate reductase [bacterium]